MEWPKEHGAAHPAEPSLADSNKLCGSLERSSISFLHQHREMAQDKYPAFLKREFGFCR